MTSFSLLLYSRGGGANTSSSIWVFGSDSCPAKGFVLTTVGVVSSNPVIYASVVIYFEMRSLHFVESTNP